MEGKTKTVKPMIERTPEPELDSIEIKDVDYVEPSRRIVYVEFDWGDKEYHVGLDVTYVGDGYRLHHVGPVPRVVSQVVLRDIDNIFQNSLPEDFRPPEDAQDPLDGIEDDDDGIGRALAEPSEIGNDGEVGGNLSNSLRKKGRLPQKSERLVGCFGCDRMIPESSISRVLENPPEYLSLCADCDKENEEQ